MEAVTNFLIADLKAHPVLLVLCVIMVWQNVALQRGLKQVARDIFNHLRNHAIERG